LSKDRYAWAIQYARSKYNDWDWELESSDHGATVTIAGIKASNLTKPVHLAKLYSEGPITHWDLNVLGDARVHHLAVKLHEAINSPYIRLSPGIPATQSASVN